jgi:hypothetical protein
MKTILIFTAAFFSSTAIGQSFNQFDAKGKKDGKWIIYLDKDWKRIDDSSKAAFKRLTYFDHGVNVYPMGPCGGKGYRLEHSSDDQSKIHLLDGEYRWHDSKCNLSSVHVFKNGEYISCKEYSTSGKVTQYFDYSKKCTGEQYGWTVFLYDENGKLKKEYPTCKDKMVSGLK